MIMDRALVVPIIAAILLILVVTQHVNSFTVVLAKSLKSSENPTLSECKGKIGKAIAITFLSACLLLYPHDLKKGEGGTLAPIDSDSSGGVDPFTHKKSR
jgi:hypothetical protein